MVQETADGKQEHLVCREPENSWDQFSWTETLWASETKYVIHNCRLSGSVSVWKFN